MYGISDVYMILMAHADTWKTTPSPAIYATRMRLTDLQIKTLKLSPKGESKQKIFFDDAMKGFGVRVSVGGSKSFVLMHGKRRRLETIGRYPGMTLAEARKKAKRVLGELVGCLIVPPHVASFTGPGFKPIGGGTGMEEIEALARSAKITKVAGGRIDEAVTIDAYAVYLAKLYQPKRPLKVVIDGGNGIIGTMLQHLLPKIPNLTVIAMNFDPDGRFPVHDANPLKAENLKAMCARVVSEKADFGAGFDGDGDRCALVDEKGGIVTCDLTTALLSGCTLRRARNTAIPSHAADCRRGR